MNLILSQSALYFCGQRTLHIFRVVRSVHSATGYGLTIPPFLTIIVRRWVRKKEFWEKMENRP